MFNVKDLSNGDVELRSYTKANIDNTVKWLNVPAIKSAFGLTYEIDHETHEKWLMNSLDGPMLICVIVKYTGIPIDLYLYRFSIVVRKLL
jgi:hypothetical protein